MACCWALGCGGSNTGSDGGDGGPPTRIEDLPIAEERSLSGLAAAVDVVVDQRGFPHIYAASAADALRVQGYLMARDRAGQMEFLRRGVEGRLAEVAGSLLPSMVEDDAAVRVLGFHRQARAIYDALPAGDPIRELLDAFAGGVSAHFQEIRAGQARLPGILSDLLRRDLMTDWSGVDTLALGRYQSYFLSYTGWDELDLTAAATGVQAAFPATSTDPALAARAGAWLDLWPMAPADPTVTDEDFLPPPPLSPRRAPSPALRSDPTQLSAARRFAAAVGRRISLLGGQCGGSNNWVLSGALTASGLPMLANDPHLSLPSPPVWWMAHLNTARTGGELDTMGVGFAGIPGVILGFNRDIAWGSTVTNYDVTDVYQETIQAGAGGAPDSVLFNGQAVPLQVLQETIPLNSGPPVELKIEFVPHHGPILPETRTADSALSVRWTGDEPSSEFAAFWGLDVGADLDDVRTALERFAVGSQNFVVATRAGDIFWSTHSSVPLRDPRALSHDPSTGAGLSPATVLPGDGTAEWTGWLDGAALPQRANPERGWLATANADPIGVSLDGNPFDAPNYLGWSFAPGYRMGRIAERLEALAATGGVRVEDLRALQADARSPLGARLTARLLAALDQAAEEAATPGTHPDLAAAVAGAPNGAMTRLAAAAERLRGWAALDFATPPAVEGQPSADEIAASSAACFFNALLPRLVQLAFGDEAARIGIEPPSGQIAKTLQWALLEPQRLRTFDAALGDTVLWDDLDTPDVQESADERILRAALLALTFLEERLGAAPDDWRWGRLHTIFFKTLVPVDLLGPGFDTFTIPPPGDPEYPAGFPRGGDNFTVDVANSGLWGGEAFDYHGGPSQRLVVEWTPDGPRAYNSLPGGQQHDPAGPHHADEAELWRRNEAPELWYEEPDVVAHAEARLRFTP